MSDFRPFIVELYSGGVVSFVDGLVTGDNSTRIDSLIVGYKMSYNNFVTEVCKKLELDSQSSSVSLLLYYSFQGIHERAYIVGDDTMNLMFNFSVLVPSYVAKIHVTWKQLQSVWPHSFTDLMVMEQSPSHQYPINYYGDHETVPSTYYNEHASSYSNFQACSSSHFNELPNHSSELQAAPSIVIERQEFHDNETRLPYEESEPEQPIESEESEPQPSEDGSDVELPVNLSSQQYGSGIDTRFSQQAFEHLNEDDALADYRLPDFDEEDSMYVWNENVHELRKGMFFNSKNDLICAVRRWNVEKGREIHVRDSKPRSFKATCKTLQPPKKGILNHILNRPQTGPSCEWFMTAVQRKNHHMWEITKWTPQHNCYPTVLRNNNRTLRSSDVATHIYPQIRLDLTFPVSQIQTYIKDKVQVDITYSKAWTARRKAIEMIHGTWESNFEELPKYAAALEDSNPGTIVRWLHHPNSSPECATFKYIFWAFGPYIKAFHFCPPVISIDATHLRGSYRGKLLIAVSKNANNYILPIAYAIVDEETNESWAWFLKQFRDNIANDEFMGKLCVISDRHHGIINAMKKEEGWKEPAAFHRFCLVHVRSNFMNKFKNSSLKKRCWEIGCTTHFRKMKEAIEEMKTINEEAWQYLRNIDRDKWTLIRDLGNRRWGNLTANISESLNNVLRGARSLPIRACIDFTFQRDVAQYVKHVEIARSCNTPLPPRLWQEFEIRDGRARGHLVDLFDPAEARYKVLSRLTTNETGGNDYTIEYNKKKCTCRKWQIFRFPCSHVIVVCRLRGETPSDIVSSRFLTTTYRQQYGGHFHPMPHKAYWRDPGWKIQGDPSKITHSRGRRRARRFRNEMDVHYPDEPRTFKCSGCGKTGHRVNGCPYRQQQ